MLDWMLFPHELKVAINELKVKGDFRPEGLRRFYFRFYTIFMSSLAFLYIYLSILPDEHILIIVSCVLVAFAIITPRSLARDMILPYSTGRVVEGEYYYVKYVTPVILNGGRCHLGCNYVDENSISHKRSWSGLISYLGRKHIRAVGEKVPIFYSKSLPADGIPYISPLFKSSCISKTRMNIDWDQFIKGKNN